MTGGNWYAVAAEPLADTILVLDRLEEVERIDALEDEGEEIRRAFRVNYAFAKPSILEQEHRAYKQKIARPLAEEGGYRASDDEKRALRELMEAIRDANARRDAGDPAPSEVS